MTKINYFLICQDVMGNEQDQIIRNPYMVLTPLGIPGNFSFTIALGLFDIQADVLHNLKIELTTPDAIKKEIINVEFNPSAANEKKSPTDIGVGNVNLGMPNFEFFQKGMHKFTTTISTSTTLDTKEVEILVKTKSIAAGE